MNVQTRTPEVEAENSRRRSERECENASERPGPGRDFGVRKGFRVGTRLRHPQVRRRKHGEKGERGVSGKKPFLERPSLRLGWDFQVDSRPTDSARLRAGGGRG